MRSNLLDVLGQQHITTARAKGLKERTVINKYAVRVAINPMISVMALEIPKIINQSALVGIVMMLPTLGPIFLRALLTQDVYLSGTILLVMTVAADALEPARRHCPGLGGSENCVQVS